MSEENKIETGVQETQKKQPKKVKDPYNGLSGNMKRFVRKHEKGLIIGFVVILVFVIAFSMGFGVAKKKAAAEATGSLFGKTTTESGTKNPFGFAEKQAFNQNIVFTEQKKGYVVSGFTDESEAYTVLTVPNEYNGKPVTAIADDAFTGHPSLEKVILGDNVKTIGDRAFKDCPNLKTVILGKGTEAIGGNAFEGCYRISSIQFPEGMKTIGNEAFVGTSLNSVYIPETVETIGENAFEPLAKLRGAAGGVAEEYAVKTGGKFEAFGS